MIWNEIYELHNGLVNKTKKLSPMISERSFYIHFRRLTTDEDKNIVNNNLLRTKFFFTAELFNKLGRFLKLLKFFI